jgi:hypothetical protein
MKVFTARKRNIELILLACVLGISWLALYLVENATDFRSPISATQIYVVIAMVLIAHLAIRVFAPFADQFLFPLAVPQEGRAYPNLLFVSLEIRVGFCIDKRCLSGCGPSRGGCRAYHWQKEVLQKK